MSGLSLVVVSLQIYPEIHVDTDVYYQLTFHIDPEGNITVCD